MEKTLLQPVGCAPKESFVLQPLVGLLPEGKPVKAPPIWRNYWSEGELCILAGDTGAGKSALALALAKEIAKGDDEIAPRKVLYIGHEYDKQGFAERYGMADEIAGGNFFFALFNQGESGLYKSYDAFKEWLLKGLENLLEHTTAKLLIFDQPDRLNLSNAQWIDLLNVVEKLRREKRLSVLLIVNTRNRSTGRPVELFHAYKHQLTTIFADSVLAVCRGHRNPYQRYIKHLKCKNRRPAPIGEVDVFAIEENENGYLAIVCDEAMREEQLLPRSKTQQRVDRIMTAESLLREGASISKIAEHFELPETTVRGWVGWIAKEKKEKVVERDHRWYPGMTPENKATYKIEDHPLAMAEQISRGYYDEDDNHVSGSRDISAEVNRIWNNYPRVGEEVPTPHQGDFKTQPSIDEKPDLHLSHPLPPSQGPEYSPLAGGEPNKTEQRKRAV